MKYCKLFFCFVFCVSLATRLSAKVFKVASPDELLAAAVKAVAGDEIVVKNGLYQSWHLVISTNGSIRKPIIIRAETSGKVIFSGDVNEPVFQLTGSYTTLSGFRFSGCTELKDSKGSGTLVELKATGNCRVTDCSFIKNISKVQFTPMVVVSGKADNNRVDHCRFEGNIDNQELQVRITAETMPLHTLIDNNEFKNKDKVSWANGNGGECIQIGQDPVLLGTKYSYTIVRDNRFTACNGEPEVVSNKASGNRYIKNVFESCQGELVMRGGHDCVIDSNTITSGSGGIRINGTNHVVTNNKLSGLATGIRLMYGMSKGKSDIGFYVAASDCTISNNHISNCNTGILIGDSKNVDWTGKFDVKKYPSRTIQDVAPFNNTFTKNDISDTRTPELNNGNQDKLKE